MEINNKHAYLILAHKNDYCFQTLLRMLDDKRNDLFIHMDIKALSYDPIVTESLVSRANVYHINRTSVQWGGYSSILAEISLLEKALSIGMYRYYHLLSGQDLPIKTQNAIHDFFDSHANYEFVRIDSNPNDSFSFIERTRFFHFFQEYLGRNYGNPYNRMFLKFQRIFGINRNSDVLFFKGPNWFSINDGFARYLVEQKQWINRVFRWTLCCDEVFIQTLLNSSSFKSNRYQFVVNDKDEAITRLIDWKRGGPYVYRYKDRGLIDKSPCCFCRKFDPAVDIDIINYISNRYSD